MSENEAKSESWDQPTGFPSIATLNRRAAEKKDSKEKRRYFQNLLVKLDGEIGEQRQTFYELLEAGELPDPVPAQLHIELMLQGCWNSWSEMRPINPHPVAHRQKHRGPLSFGRRKRPLQNRAID